MASNTFKDHFSEIADHYARYRPTYPKELFQFVADQCEGHKLVWDCGTGNGQTALGLTEHFEQVYASDASKEQIDAAIKHPKIHYHCHPAEDCPLDFESADLVTVSQALHWFDFERFFSEARRVLKPNGRIAVWCYELAFTNHEELNSILTDKFYRNILHRYWPKERQHVQDHYRSIPFPFVELPTEPMFMEAQWDLNQLIGYLETWSASQKYFLKKGVNATTLIKDEIEALWGPADSKQLIMWPIHMRLGKKE